MRAHRDLVSCGGSERAASWPQVRDVDFEVLAIRVCPADLAQLVTPAIVVGMVARVARRGQIPGDYALFVVDDVTGGIDRQPLQPYASVVIGAGERP